MQCFMGKRCLHLYFEMSFFCSRIWIFRCVKTQGRTAFKIKLMHAHYRRAHLHFRCFIYLDLHAWNSYRCPLFTASWVSTILNVVFACLKITKRASCSLFLLMWWGKIINMIITRNIVKLMTLLLKIEPITQDFRCHHERKRILQHYELNCQ